ncbi:asparagine synthase-related protein [Rubinisphaera sp. JC750]|uniref:asparagine synthase-related protein n=1 Tax=Rubinisphaera sp. JC750 TaxID=2898658 RepID=UPI001F01EF98|nr:asparagine synthase-related protein [Rubinisphaera sp. JC750]
MGSLKTEHLAPQTARDIQAFLWYCYVLRSSNSFLTPLLDDPLHFATKTGAAASGDLRESVLIGSSLLRSIMNRLYTESSPPHIVPLSGGIDSRLILGLLLEMGARPDITAVTFGTAGTWDFELAKHVARSARVKHVTFELSQLPLDAACMKQAFDSGASGTDLVTGYYNHFWKSQFPSDATIWSGFLGGEIAGAHYKQGYEDCTWAEAKNIFTRSNKWCNAAPRSFDCARFSPESVLPECPLFTDSRILSYPEQLDFSIRQPAYIHRTLVGNATNFKLPFTQPDWVRYMLSRPPRLRANCSLYHRIADRLSPRLFRIPTKNSLMASRRNSTQTHSPFRSTFRNCIRRCKSRLSRLTDRRTPVFDHPHPQINFVDFINMFPHRPDIKSLALDASQALMHGPASCFVNNNQRKMIEAGTLDGYELNLLISLEANIRHGAFGLDTSSTYQF